MISTLGQNREEIFSSIKHTQHMVFIYTDCHVLMTQIFLWLNFIVKRINFTDTFHTFNVDFSPTLGKMGLVDR